MITNYITLMPSVVVVPFSVNLTYAWNGLPTTVDFTTLAFISQSVPYVSLFACVILLILYR